MAGRRDAATGFPKRVVLVLLAGVMLLFGFAVRSPAGKAVGLSPGMALRLIEENREDHGFIVLDVRTGEEYREGHIPGALLIDFRSPTFRDEIAALDRNRTYLIYCRTGNRSGSAVQLMEELGFGSIYHLEGGIVSWNEEGLPVVR